MILYCLEPMVNYSDISVVMKESGEVVFTEEDVVLLFLHETVVEKERDGEEWD